jgi:hypothetical protein
MGTGRRVSEEVAMVEWANLVVSILFSVVAAYWAFFKWTAEREKDRQTREEQLGKERQAREDQLDKERREREQELERERKRLAALYVNPFLLACEELQSRLYNILGLGGLSVLKARYPDGGYAEEILYLVAQYFAWELCLYRYTPYAQDREVIRLTETIRQDFATDEQGVGAFCFFRPEQRNLGRLLQDRVAGTLGSEFDVISLYAFKEKLASTQFLGSPAIQLTLDALKETKFMAQHPNVRKRLAKIQNHLVELLEYIELREGITFFLPPEGQDKRNRANQVPPTNRTEARDEA